MSSNVHDAIIVGARPAGAATALLLARAGLDVLVVDRSRYGADTLSTHALMRAGVVQLHRWGLLDAVVDAGTPPVRRTTFTYADDEVTVTIKPSHGVDALYAPRRTVLDPLLADAALAAGAEVRYGVTATGVTRGSSGRVDGVTVRDAAGRTAEHRGRWVIGADGIRSVVARSVSAPVEWHGTGATAVVYGYWTDLPTDGYQWVYRPNAFAGLIPTNDDATCVFTAEPAGRAGRGGRGGRDALHRNLDNASPAVAERVRHATAPAAVRAFPGLPGYLRTPVGPGWALVGDAGYWKDPISAHGLTDAFRDAELLARAIIAAAGGIQTEADALGAYHRTRNRLALPLFDVVDRIAAAGWTDDEIPALLRQLSSAMSSEVEHLCQLDDGVTIGAGR